MLRKEEPRQFEKQIGTFCCCLSVLLQCDIFFLHLHSRSSPAGIPEPRHVPLLLHNKVHHPRNEYSQRHHQHRCNRYGNGNCNRQGVAAIPSVPSALAGLKKYTWSMKELRVSGVARGEYTIVLLSADAAQHAPTHRNTPHHNTSPHRTAPRCNITPHRTRAPHRTVTRHTAATHRTTPHHTIPHCTAPQHNAPHHRNTPHHTTPHRTAPHYTTPHPAVCPTFKLVDGGTYLYLDHKRGPRLA